MTDELTQEKVRLDAEVTNLKQLLLNKDKTIQPGVSVKFLMVGETRSMVGYHLMAEDHSIQFGVWRRGGGAMTPPAGAGQHHGGI